MYYQSVNMPKSNAQKQTAADLTETFLVSKNGKKDIVVDKALIKQFAHRIYDDMKAYLQDDREEGEKLIRAIFGGDKAALAEYVSLAQQSNEDRT